VTARLIGRVVVGVDPGGAETGVVARHRDRCLFRTVVVRTRGMAMAWYLREVVDVVTDAFAHADTVGHADEVLLAVEGLNAPNPRMGMIAVRGILDTAQVLGAVTSHWPAAIVVDPDGHGTGPFAAYPAQLRPTRGCGRGHDQLRHTRSAWDVAGAGVLLAALEQRGGGQR
jgi:hypothetical protein